MADRIFKAMTALVSLTMCMFLVFFITVVFNYIVKNEAEHLSVAIKGIETSFRSDYSKIGDDLAERGIRMTLVDEDGTVLMDNNQFYDISDNHLDRYEIKQAQSEGESSTIRFSKTMNSYNLYRAKKLPNGDIIRLGVRREKLFLQLFEESLPLIWVLIILILSAYKIARRLSQEMIQPINNIDLAHPYRNKVPPEVLPLVNRISAQNKLIDQKTSMIKKSKEEIGAIIEQLSRPLIILDKKNRIRQINKAARTLFSLRRGSPLSKIDRVIDEIDIKTIIDHVRRTGEYESMDIKIKGRKYFIKGNTVEDRFVSLLFVDVTERALSEEMRRNFTVNVSHELRTPLQSIMGSAELINTGVVEDEDMKLFAGIIYDESQRLLGLINDLLQLAKMDENKIIFQDSLFDVKELIEGIAQKLEIIADKANITIELDLEECKIENDKKIVHEIIYNIVENAIKYGRKDGYVKVILRNTDCCEIMISDNGIGIELKEQKRIFERFYRVEKSRSKETAQGTGLGLAIVKHGVELCQGKLYLNSELGVGTTMKVELPRKRKI